MPKFRGTLACALMLAPVVAFVYSLPASAQFENGGLLGVIKDPSGAPIANATVTVTNTATSIALTTTTNASGNYDVPQLRVGVYTISASSAGFSAAVAQDVTVSVGNRQHIDLTLKVGGSAETVEVSGVALQLETETSERGQTITNYQTEAFPLVTRNYSDLLGLVTGSRQAPSAATTSSISSLVRAGAYNINGERSVFNNFILDGIDNNSYGESNQGFDNQIIAIPPDSVAQFQVVTNNESAEYGRASGATINVASLSGTNQIHFTAYEFIRNTDLNATGFFHPTVGTTAFKKPTFNRNQFGINLGGPIIKDKFFGFLDYEGFRQVLRPLTVLTLPTQNELNGILVVPVRNPLTGVVYAAGTPVPSSQFSGQVINFFKQVKGLPVAGSAATGLASNDYSVQVPFDDNSDKGDLRLDYQISPQQSAFLRISDRKENAINFPTLPLPLDSQSNGNIRVLDQQIALGYTHLFGSNKIFDFRLGLDRTKAGKFTLSLGNNSITIPGLQGVPANLAGGLPTTAINQFTAFGRQSTNPQFQNPALIDPKVNFTIVKGAHSLKFGAEYERLYEGVLDNNPFFGSFTYGGAYSLCPGGTTVAGSTVPCPAGPVASSAAVADNFFADFLFGTTSAYSLANFYEAHLTQNLLNFYAQDDWKVSPKLTLNLGLRYEYGSPYADLYNRVSNFDPGTGTILTTDPGVAKSAFITPISAGGTYGKTLVNPDRTDLAPRLGFAYSVDPQTVIRGGFGTSYVHYTRAGSGDILPINAPQALFVAVNQNNQKPTTTNLCPANPTVAQVGTGAGTCYVSADEGFPQGLATTFNPLTDNTSYIPKNTRDSYVESYFLSVQRQVLKNSLLDIAYVGNHEVHLQGFINENQLNPAIGFAQANRPFPAFSDITEASNEFYGNYNSLQIRYEQRATFGLTLLNSFTYSRSLDNASASLEGQTPSLQDANNPRADYGQSDYNLPVQNVTSLVYELPVGHGRQFMAGSNGVVNALIGGWQVSIINTMQSGTPFNLTYSPTATNQVSPTISSSFRGANLYRPNIVPGVNPKLNTQIAASGFIQYVNPAAFSLPATSVTNAGVTTLLSPFGNEPRNYLRNTAFYQTDLALNKRFNTPIERAKIEFRSEFYNIINHTNLYVPSSTNLAGTNNGSAATGNGVITSTFTPRVIQFGLKILY